MAKTNPAHDDSVVRAAARALRKFDWHNYGLDEVADADPEWTWFAALKVVAAVVIAQQQATAVTARGEAHQDLAGR